MSRRKDLMSWGLVALVLVLVGFGAYYVFLPQLQPHVTLHLGDGIFTSRLARTEAEREKGLSGTHSLRDDQAMLLIYDNDDKWPIWMKGMNYPIDIIWLDKDKTVVYIVKNAPPESYPYEQFVPKEKARYVVEVTAGTVAKKRIVIGAQANFDENNVEGLRL